MDVSNQNKLMSFLHAYQNTNNGKYSGIAFLRRRREKHFVSEKITAYSLEAKNKNVNNSEISFFLSKNVRFVVVDKIQCLKQFRD